MTKHYLGSDLEAMSLGLNYSQWIMQEFEPFTGSVVAEVGAGSGNLSQMLLRHPLKELIAIEPDENMYALLEKRLRKYPNVKIFRSVLRDICEDFTGQLDTIFYISVLEHIAQDEEELKHAYASLKCGGHLCLFVPALTWLYSDFDAAVGHHRRYTLKRLKGLVTAGGFEIVKAKYFDCLGVLPWFFVFVLMKRTLMAPQVRFYDRIAVPIMRRIERAIHVPFGKNLVLVGKKGRHQ